MVSAINTALSGLAAASQRLAVSSGNIANINSTSTRDEQGNVTNTPYIPQDVVQISNELGGVQAQTVDRSNPYSKVYAPDHPNADETGFLSVPNVDIASELVQSKIATYDYRANLKSIKAQDELFKDTLDILS